MGVYFVYFNVIAPKLYGKWINVNFLISKKTLILINTVSDIAKNVRKTLNNNIYWIKIIVMLPYDCPISNTKHKVV